MYVIQKAERTVVELTLENGIVGLGDTWGTPEVFGLAKQFAKGWLGKDALDRFALRSATLGKSNYDYKYGRNGRAARAGESPAHAGPPRPPRAAVHHGARWRRRRLHRRAEQ